jgi:sulfopyruvate decarboxylase TPP-binding subunit
VSTLIYTDEAGADARVGSVTEVVLEVLRQCGVERAVGVPDSQLGDVLVAVDRSFGVTFTLREDVAVAMAIGARLVGQSVVVFMKNAGLGTSLDAIVSLSIGCELPLLLVVGWAGAGRDELPHHVIMGERTRALLDASGIEHDVVRGSADVEHLVRRAHCAERHGRPYALLVEP